MIEPGPIAVARDLIDARLTELAAQIDRDYPLGLTLLGMAPEGECLTTDLAALVRVPCRTDVIGVSAYRPGAKGRARLEQVPRGGLRGQPVLVSALVVDTGLRLRIAIDAVARRAPASLRALALLDRRARRLIEALPLTYVGFEVPDCLYGGYGLGAAHGLAGLPDIHYLDAADAVRIRRMSTSVA